MSGKRSGKVLLVSGLGRCGSSAMMQMLERGGVKCAGHFPAYEESETNHSAMPEGWLSQWRGCAVKLLDPHYSPRRDDSPCVIIWMKRDTRQQAKSQIKFTMMLQGMAPILRSADIKRMESGLREETPQALASFGDSPIIEVRFEDMLINSLVVAGRVAKFLASHGFAFDAAKGSLAIHRRELACAPGIDMELSLIAAVRP